MTFPGAKTKTVLAVGRKRILLDQIRMKTANLVPKMNKRRRTAAARKKTRTLKTLKRKGRDAANILIKYTYVTLFFVFGVFPENGGRKPLVLVIVIPRMMNPGQRRNVEESRRTRAPMTTTTKELRKRVPEKMVVRRKVILQPKDIAKTFAKSSRTRSSLPPQNQPPTRSETAEREWRTNRNCTINCLKRKRQKR